MPDIMLFTPQQILQPGDPGLPPLEQFELQFLAQGDSWFSIGALPPWLTTNLFDHLSLDRPACAVNCAAPGLQLARMTDTTRAPAFLQLLNGRAARRWTGLLLSGGGNDMIEATQSGPEQPAALRLLAPPAEWSDAPDAGRYLSEPGWQTFVGHLTAVFARLIAARDDPRSPNAGIPVFLHSYDFTTPRNAPAGGGHGPWLVTAVRAFGIPEADWAALGRTLMQRLSALLHRLAADPRFPNVMVVDTQGTLQPALTTDTHATLHWQNEIHPTRTGYRLLADRWEQVINARFPAGPTRDALLTPGVLAGAPVVPGLGQPPQAPLQ